MTPIYNSTIFTTVPYRITVDTVQCIHRSAPLSHTFLPALRSTLLARYPYSTQVARELYGYIYTIISALRGATRHWAYILMQSYLQHQDIDGHLLRLYIYIYIFCGDTYIRNVTERQFLAQPERRKDKDHQQCFRFLFFVFCFFFTVIWEQGLK